MFIFYVIALLIAIGGSIAWHKSEKIVFWEWAVTAGVAFAMAIAFHISAFVGMTDDIETLSGQVTEARYVPAWYEEYQKSHTRMVGKMTQTYYTTEHQWHSEYWTITDTLGETDTVDKSFYDSVCSRFGGPIQAVAGDRRTFKTSSRRIAGDGNDYIGTNVTNAVVPVNRWYRWTNRIKAAPSAFSFTKLRDRENAAVFEYPANDDHFASNRLLGPTGIPVLEWDQFNADVGPAKGVNVIVAGFGNQDASIAELQRAKWIGGKKNDLVVCFGGAPNAPTWCRVFGWTEADVCKYNIQTLVMQTGVGPKLLPKLRDEIVRTYEKKDWTKFDYLTIEPPMWSYLVYFATVLLVQGGMWIYFTCNYTTKTPMRCRNTYGY